MTFKVRMSFSNLHNPNFADDYQREPQWTGIDDYKKTKNTSLYKKWIEANNPETIEYENIISDITVS